MEALLGPGEGACDDGVVDHPVGMGAGRYDRMGHRPAPLAVVWGTVTDVLQLLLNALFFVLAAVAIPWELHKRREDRKERQRQERRDFNALQRRRASEVSVHRAVVPNGNKSDHFAGHGHFSGYDQVDVTVVNDSDKVNQQFHLEVLLPVHQWSDGRQPDVNRHEKLNLGVTAIGLGAIETFSLMTPYSLWYHPTHGGDFASYVSAILDRASLGDFRAWKATYRVGGPRWTMEHGRGPVARR